MPSPQYPSRQVQVKLPGVLVQFACELQFPLLLAHSSTSGTAQQNKVSAQINQNKQMYKTRKNNWGIVAQLTDEPICA